MKKLISVVFLVFMVTQATAQVETCFYTKSEVFRSDLIFSKKSTVVHTMPSFDLERMQKEDAEMEGEDVPYRFGKGFDVSYSFDDGQWEDVEGGRLWSISFKSEGAVSLNYIFENFYLPEGDRLYIENQDKTVVYGPVTSEAVSKEYDSFLTDIIPGDQSTIYLFEPLDKKGESKLTIKRVVHGYRGIIFDESYGTVGNSSSCNYDVACLPAYNKESNAVALVLLSNGEELCSGSLLMNTDLTYAPYFLTAFHCIDFPTDDGYLSDAEKSAAENWMFKFCFKKTSCNGSNLTTSYTYNKADFCAAWYNTDFALMKIKGNVSQNSNLTWLGWDKTGDTPSSTTCIHHPEGDVMKISVDNDSATSINRNGGINNHWHVNFDFGIYQPGSSGSPLLNSGKKVIGQLWGGPNPINVCNRTIAYYGKLSQSWTGGGTNSTRLSNWLDPSGWGITVMPGSADLIISGSEHLYGSGIYSLASLPSAMSVNWSLSGENAADYIIETNTPSTNQCRITQKTDVDIYGSPSLTLTAQIMYGGSVFTTVSKNLTGHFISGPMVPCGTTFYYVDPLPANHTVEWEADGQNLGYDNVQSGTIPADLYPYVIDHQQNERHYGTLTATVKSGNTVVGTLVKQIDTAGGFTGTWYQEPTLTDSTNAIPQPFFHQSSLPIVPERRVYLMSDDFANSTITHNGNGFFLMYWYNSNGVISFIPVPPINTPPGKILFENINGRSADGCMSFSFQIIRAPQLSLPFTLSANPSGGSCQFTLSAEEEERSSADERQDVSNAWHLTVTRSDTGSTVYESSVSGMSKTVGTSGWESGIYIATALVNGQNVSCKFAVSK